MLKIGIDISPLASSSRTGVGEYTYELLHALFDIDSENQYFLFYNGFKDVSACIPKWNQKNVHGVCTRWPNKLFHASLQFLRWPKMDRIIEQKAGGTLDYFFSPNIGFHSVSKKCKHILTVHDLSFEIFPECFSLKRRLWHILLSPKKPCQKANRIIVPSENTKQDIVDMYGISPEKIKVIYSGLSSIFFEKSLPHNAFDVKNKYNLPSKYILFLGTVEPRKNIEGLIDAFHVFQQEFPEYHLVIAGANGWKNKRIFAAIEKNTNVQYIGYVAEEDKPALYAGAKIFVYPSLYEGFGFPILEAFASGVPVITSARSSLPEIAGNAAYYINPNNSFEIVEGMRRFVTDPELSTFFRQKGFEQIKKFYWKKTAEQFLASL